MTIHGDKIKHVVMTIATALQWIPPIVIGPNGSIGKQTLETWGVFNKIRNTRIKPEVNQYWSMLKMITTRKKYGWLPNKIEVE